MRVYVSVDLEGIAGISTIDQITRGGTGYPAATRLMTAETNAAIAGAFDAGAEAVTVNDSHGTMDNLSAMELDPRARLIIGTPKAQCMAQGLTPDFDAAVFIGYHGSAGSRGVLAHTVSSNFAAVKLNGVLASEADINCLYAATQGVPVAFISGDNIICADADRFMPHATKVVVKEATGWSAADSLHPLEAARAIMAGVRASLSDLSALTLPPPEGPWLLHVEMQQPMAAELAASVPGAVLAGSAVERTVEDIGEVIGLITVWSALANTAALARLPMLQRR